MTGIPVFNVNNNCSTGSTALFLARQAVASGVADCALALGFEQMETGRARRRSSPTGRRRFDDFDARDRRAGRPRRTCRSRSAISAAPGRAHMQKYGTKLRDVREDPRQGEPPRREQSARAVPQGASRVEEVLASPVLMPGVMTRLMAARRRAARRRRSSCSDDFAQQPRHRDRRVAHRRPGDDDRHARARSRRTT